MKKRWLVMITSCMMAIILCFGFAACGDNKTEKPSDTAATVRTVENAIKMMYAETSTGSQSYSVAGRWRVGDGKYCDITWTATAKTDGIKIEDYVTIGTRDATTYEVPITIKQGTVDITYTLNGAFTIDGVQGNASFDKTIPALKTATNDGSAEHPFTISDVFIIADTLSNGGFYQKDGKNARVYIKGIVVNPGSFQEAKGNYPDELASVRIADEAEDTANAVSIAYIVFTDYFKNPGNKSNPLSKGDTITVLAFIERYNDKPSIYYAKEDPNDTSAQTLYPEITEWVKAPKSDADLAQEAVDAVSIGRTVYAEAKEFDLPKAQGTATLTWAVKGTSTNVEVTNAGKLNVKSLPTADTEVTLTVTATVKEAHKEKDVKITLCPTPTAKHAGTQTDPYSVADVLALGKLIYNEFYMSGNAPAEIYVKGYVTDAGKIYAPSGSNDFYMSSVYIADEKGTLNKATDLQLYTVSYGEAVEKPAAKPSAATISVDDEVVIKGYLKDYKGTKEIDKDDTDKNNVKYPVFTSYTKAEVEEVEIPANAVTVKKTIGEVATANTWKTDGSVKYDTFTLDDKVTVTTGVGEGKTANNNGKCYTTKEVVNWRLYYSESATLTIAVASGYNLVAVKITWTTGSFTESIKSGVQQAASGTSVTFNVAVNIQITEIEVVYVPAAATTSAAPVALLPRKDA